MIDKDLDGDDEKDERASQFGPFPGQPAEHRTKTGSEKCDTKAHVYLYFSRNSRARAASSRAAWGRAFSSMSNPG